MVDVTDAAPAALQDAAPTRLEALGAKAREYARKSKARGTARLYTRDWNAFVAWCLEHGARDLPAAPATVGAYVAHLADSKAVATINVAVAAISQIHQAAGYESPTQTAEFRAVWRGVRREKGVAPTKKRAATAPVVRAMLEELPEGTMGLRDKALILVAFGLGVRRSELVALDVEDLAQDPRGLAVAIRRSKTDQEGAGRTVALLKGAHPKTCPVRALEEWLSAAAITEGPMFRAVDQKGRVGEGRLCDRTVARVVKRTIERLGGDYEKAEWAGHSTRRGHITEAYKSKGEASIARTTGHRSMATLRGYREYEDAFEDASSGGLGL